MTYLFPPKPKHKPFQVQFRANSLKPNASIFTNPHSSLTKRHSLDSRPHHHKNSLLDNIEDLCLVTSKHWGSSKGALPNKPKENCKIKYYVKGKQKKEKKNVDKIKRNWSHMQQTWTKGNKKKQMNRTKWQSSLKINISGRLQTKNDALNGKSTSSITGKRQELSLNNAKMTKSILNSTMLTKRQSNQTHQLSLTQNNNKLQGMLSKIKAVLGRYQEKIQSLREEKDFYRLKYKQLRKRKGNI